MIQPSTSRSHCRLSQRTILRNSDFHINLSCLWYSSQVRLISQKVSSFGSGRWWLRGVKTHELMLMLLTPITPTATFVPFHFPHLRPKLINFHILYHVFLFNSRNRLFWERPAMILCMLQSVRSSTWVHEATTETMNNLIWKYFREKRLVPHA